MPEHELPMLPGLRLIREMGRGGGGVVYAAERVADGVPVAVKLLHAGPAGEHRHRLLRAEADRTAAVDHPGIVRVLEIGDDGTRTWLVLDLVDGPSLQRVLDERGPLPPPLAAHVLAQAADAVAAVHAAGIAHGDLKPGNILLRQWPGPDTTIDLGAPVLVTDFGLARALPGAQSLDLSGGVEWLRSGATAVEPVSPAGTVAYMAPEQWRGEPLTARSDVYALGGTLYAALTGDRPFPQQSLPELAYAVAATPAPEPTRRATGVPPSLDAVVARAMAKNPAERYADAAEFAAAIRDGAHSPPAGPAEHRRRPRRWARAAGRLLSPAALLLALMAFGSGFLTVSCAPGGYGRAAPGATTTYTGADLATGSEPRVDKPRPGGATSDDRLGGQPLMALAWLLLAGATVATIRPRRRPHRTIAALAGSAAVALAVGEAVARAELLDRFASQLSAPLPPGRHASDFIHVGNAFWTSLVAAVVVTAGHAIVATRSGTAAHTRSADSAPAPSPPGISQPRGTAATRGGPAPPAVNGEPTGRL